MAFVLFISFFITQRISELLIARKNEKWLRTNGAVEYGQKHYPFIVLLHVLFITSLIAEHFWRGESYPDIFFLIVFVILLSAKIWVIASLGNFWNTKIFRIPNTPLIRKGPYKFFKHPNYLIVVCEFIVVPLVFHLYYSAIVFSLVNAFILGIRIHEENSVLGS
jgi:methyltransferase